jgi:Tol biopolymer transport system component
LRPSIETPASPSLTFTQLTTQGGVESFPSLSPDGGSIVYVVSGDMYLQRVGGQKAINLTEDSPADDTQPAFSPDGAQIAFRSGRDGGGLFVMGALGESVKRISDAGFNPSWSSDGESIVFSTESVDSADRGPDVSELRVVRLATGEVRSLDVRDGVQPSWSPRGHRIAFWSHSLTERNYRDIWTVPVEGGEVKAVTRDEHIDWNPVWSPDGKYLYFCSTRGGAMSLWRVAIDEETGTTRSEPELVTASPAARMGQIAIARDGRRMAYQADISTQNLQKISFGPESERVVGDPVAITSGSRWVVYPEVSPDGNWVAFGFSAGGGQGDIAVIRADGTGIRQLTDDPHLAHFAPRWSPDGRELVIYSARTGNVELWSIHPDGSGLRQLTQTASRSLCPLWSPDGKRMVYCSGEDSFIFHPGLPWNAQSPEKLPRPPAGVFQAYSWSSDGEMLAGELQSQELRIATFSLVEREYEVFPVAGDYPKWLSDNRRLLFRQSGKILLFDSTTGASHEILSLEPDSIYESFDLSRDDRTIYFVRSHAEADIWMVTLDEAAH